MMIAALAATIDAERFQHADIAAVSGVFRDEKRDHTALVDGACIFLNRPGFAGGGGCALHLQAVHDGDRPVDSKPTVCWQLPLWVETADDGARVMRRWSRKDWGEDADMAWCCTEVDDTQVGDEPTADYLSDELTAIVGPEVSVAIRERCRWGRS